MITLTDYFKDLLLQTATAGGEAMPPGSLAFSAQPVNVVAGATLPAVAVQLLDRSGHPMTGDSTSQATIRLVNPAGATLGGTLTRMAAGGQVAFDDLTVDLAGTYCFYVELFGDLVGFCVSVVSAEFAVSQPAYPSMGDAPNLMAWFDLSDNATVLNAGNFPCTPGSTTTGEIIATVDDKTAFHRNATGAGTVRYHAAGIGGKNTAYGDGLTGVLSAATVAAAVSGDKPSTTYCVVKFAGVPSANAAPVGFDDGGTDTGINYVRWDHSTGDWIYSHQNDAASTVSIEGGAADTGEHILVFHRYPDGTGVIEVDGYKRADFKAMPGTTTLTLFSILAVPQSGGPIQLCNADVGEVAVAFPGHNDAQRLAAVQGLGAKWTIPVRRSALTWYFDPAAGSDANNGTSPTTPKQTAAALNGLTLQYGDVVRLKAGGVMNARINFTLPFADNNASPLVVSTYGGLGRASVSTGTDYGITSVSTPCVALFHLAPFGAPVTVSTSDGGLTYTTNYSYVVADAVAGIEFINTRIPARLRGPYLFDCNPTNYVAGIAVIEDAGAPNLGYQGGCVLKCPTSNNVVFGIHFASTGGLLPGVFDGFLISDPVVSAVYGDSHNFLQPGSGAWIYFLANHTNLTIRRPLGYASGQAAPTAATVGTGGLDLINCQHVVVSNPEVYALKDPKGTDGEALMIDQGCDDVSINYGYSHENSGPGLFFGASSATVTGTGTFRYCITQNDGQGGTLGAVNVNTPGAANYTAANFIGCSIFYTATIGSNQYAFDNRTNPAGSGLPTLLNCAFWVRGGAKFGNLAAGTVWVNHNYDTDGAFHVNVAGTDYASLSALHAATIANVEYHAGTPYGIQGPAGVPGAGTGTAQMPGQPIPNNLAAYDPAPGSALVGHGIDPMALFGISPGALDFHGNPAATGGVYSIGAVNPAAP